MSQSLTATLLFAELILFIASWYRLQDGERGIAEALTRSLALSLVSLGFAVLVLFLLHLASQHWIVDAMILAFAAAAWRFGKRPFAGDMLRACRSLRSEPLAWFLLALTGSLLALILALPPTNWDSMVYNLARVLMMGQENTLALVNYNSFRQLAFSPGFDLLHFFFLRFKVDQGIAVFSLMAYMVIVLASYSLARERGGRALALRVAVVIACLKLVVLQATSTKNDLGAAAVAVACVMGASSLLSRKKPGELFFFMACLAFGLSVKTYFLLFAVPFMGAFAVIHRVALVDLFRRLRREAPRLSVLALAMFLLLACVGLSSQIICLERFGNPYGPPEHVARHENRDGAAGALANAARYVMQATDLPGRWWYDATLTVHQRLFGEGNGPGAALRFQARYVPAAQWFEDEAWFGMVGGLLVLPAVLACLGAADRMTRAVSWGLCGYFMLISFSIAWMNYNCRFFTLFFASSALCLAAARRVWHDRVWLRRAVLAVSMLTALAALILNQDKPLLDYETLPGGQTDLAKSVFHREPGRRSVYDEHFHNPVLLEYLSRGVFPRRNILLVAGEDSWVYPLLRYTDHHWVVTGEDNPVVRLDGETFDAHDCAQLARLGGRFDLVIIMEDKSALACRVPWKLVMRTWSNWGDIVVYDPHLPGE